MFRGTCKVEAAAAPGEGRIEARGWGSTIHLPLVSCEPSSSPGKVGTHWYQPALFPGVPYPTHPTVGCIKMGDRGSESKLPWWAIKFHMMDWRQGMTPLPSGASGVPGCFLSLFPWRDMIQWVKGYYSPADKTLVYFLYHQYFSASFQNFEIEKYYYNFPGGLDGKVCLQCGRPGFNPWARKNTWRRKWQPTPVFLRGKSHGQRSLVGYSPWDHKESDTTQQLSTHKVLIKPSCPSK